MCMHIDYCQCGYDENEQILHTEYEYENKMFVLKHSFKCILLND